MMPASSRLPCLRLFALLSFLTLLLSAAPDGRAQLLPPPVAAAPNIPAPTPVPLYPGTAPGAMGHAPADRPVLYPFVPVVPAATGLRAAVLVIPGGGYSKVALGHEGFQYAEWLNQQGIAAYVLDYRVSPYRYPVEMKDAATAMRYVRGHAAENQIDPDRIGVWGSSAGGSLAALLATECQLGGGPVGPSDVDCRPDFAILAYPVISMEEGLTHAGSRDGLLGPDPSPEMVRLLSAQYAVTTKTPPTFLFATTGDPAVPVGNSVAMYSALVAKGVPVEMHLFDFSNHGCGLCGEIPTLSGWPLLLRTWLVKHNELGTNAPPPPPPAMNMAVWPAGVDGPGK